MRKFSGVIAAAVREGVSDIHITGAHPVVFRKNGQIQQDRSIKWTHAEVDTLVRKLLTPRQIQILRREWSVDLAVTIQHVRLRLNVFNTTRGLSLAIRLLPGDTRYLPVIPENTLVRVEASGQMAQVTGRVILTGAGTANTLWVLATSYDAAGSVVGVRRWESASALTATAPISFDFLVYSVGPGIDRVEFLAEARP